MEPADYTLVIVNLVAGIGCAIPVARLLRQTNNKPTGLFPYLVVLVGIYFVECCALVMGMLIPVFPVGLALLWGIVFGLWLRARTSRRDALKASLFLSLYSVLPMISFMLVPVMMWMDGWDILGPEEGARFGIPEFLHLPWPINTILGFFATLATGVVLLKIVITMGEVRLFIHLGQRSKLSDS